MSKYEVFYFPTTGRAEFARQLLEYSDADWVDRYPKEWPAEKPDTPYGKLPVLYEHQPNGETFMLAETQAIEIYLANKFGLMGESPQEKAQRLSVYLQWYEVTIPFFTERFGSEEIKQSFQDLFIKNFEYLLVKHGELLNKNGTGLYFGEKITAVDIQAFGLFQLFKEHPRFEEVKEHVAPLEKLCETMLKDAKFRKTLENASERNKGYKPL
ncbi:hypothetical protein IWQ62_001684 [Dispira parvispora]|uniref:GST N-terminal domain-containing protein n=1 Tax=Dispira parvispora TaxID=1520584 RepID=A0A9W8AVI5_9FUNG|nr:hypothetical protein IWQ62_001684 [Dispira parvispora]